MRTEAYQLTKEHTFENGNVVPAGTVVQTTMQNPITDPRDGSKLVHCIWEGGKVGNLPVKHLRKL